MLLAAYDAVESLASLSSRVESRFRSDKKRTLKSAPVVGHNGFRYRVHSDWGIPDEPSRYPVKDCHEMVVDSLGRIVLLTNHQKNNILIYNADGQIVDSWTLGFRSAHGLSLIHEQTDRKFNRMRPSMARVFGFETRRPRQTKAD